jgi:hypothetical protein
MFDLDFSGIRALGIACVALRCLHSLVLNFRYQEMTVTVAILLLAASQHQMCHIFLFHLLVRHQSPTTHSLISTQLNPQNPPANLPNSLYVLPLNHTLALLPNNPFHSSPFRLRLQLHLHRRNLKPSPTPIKVHQQHPLCTRSFGANKPLVLHFSRLEAVD